jgi:hypothetical protein
MTQLLTPQEDEVCDQSLNNLPMEFARDGNGKEGEDDDERNIVSDLSLRRIVVCDGIVERQIRCSECDFSVSRIWIPRDLEVLESIFLSKF